MILPLWVNLSLIVALLIILTGVLVYAWRNFQTFRQTPPHERVRPAAPMTPADLLDDLPPPPRANPVAERAAAVEAERRATPEGRRRWGVTTAWTRPNRPDGWDD